MEAARTVLAAARQDSRRRMADAGHERDCAASAYGWGEAVALAWRDMESEPGACGCTRRRRRRDAGPIIEVRSAQVLVIQGGV